MTKPAAQFLVQYNSYTLPGYAQGESFEDAVQITDYAAPYTYDPISENMGTNPKNLTVSMLVMDDSYYLCREQIQTAATYLKSRRRGYADLYVGYTDRYYQAIPVSLKYAKDVKENYRTSKYDVVFKAKPYLLSAITHTISSSIGNELITTDVVSRTTADGTYSPCIITITGADLITISGYTETGDFCGFLSFSGYNDSESTFTIDSSNYTTVDESGKNQNTRQLYVDYALFVGTGKTYFEISGEGQIDITWNDRWAL